MDIGLDCRGFLFHQRCRCKYMPHWIRNYFRVCFCVHVRTVLSAGTQFSSFLGLYFPVEGHYLNVIRPELTQICWRDAHTAPLSSHSTHKQHIRCSFFQGQQWSYSFGSTACHSWTCDICYTWTATWKKNLWGVIHINSNPAGKRGWWWG